MKHAFVLGALMLSTACPPSTDQAIQANPTPQAPAAPKDCLVEKVVGAIPKKPRGTVFLQYQDVLGVDQDATKHCQQRLAEGWRLLSAGNQFVWVK